MNRQEQHARNQAVIARVAGMIEPNAWPLETPSYARVVATLNDEGFRKSRENPWTRRALYRMLQREGIAGIHGLAEQTENGYSPTRKNGQYGTSTRARAREAQAGEI